MKSGAKRNKYDNIFDLILEKGQVEEKLAIELAEALSRDPAAGGADFMRYFISLPEDKRLLAQTILKDAIVPRMSTHQKVGFIRMVLESSHCSLSNFKSALELVSKDKEEARDILSKQEGKVNHVKSVVNICLQYPTVEHLAILQYISDDPILSTAIVNGLTLQNTFFDCQRANVEGEKLKIAHEMLDIIAANLDAAKRDAVGLVNFAVFFNYPKLVQQELERNCKLDVKGQRETTVLTDLLMGQKREEVMKLLVNSERFTAAHMGDMRQDLIFQMINPQEMEKALFQSFLDKFSQHFLPSFQASADYCMSFMIRDLGSPSVSLDRILLMYQQTNGHHLRNWLKLNMGDKHQDAIEMVKNMLSDFSAGEEVIQRRNKFISLLMLEDPKILTADLNIRRQYTRYDVYAFLECLKNVDSNTAMAVAGTKNQDFISRIVSDTNTLINYAIAKNMSVQELALITEKLVGMAVNLKAQGLVGEEIPAKITEFHIQCFKEKVSLQQTNKYYSWVNKSMGWDDPYTIGLVVQRTPLQIVSDMIGSQVSMKKYSDEIGQSTTASRQVSV